MGKLITLVDNGDICFFSLSISSNIAIIRFLSLGVGLVIAFSLVVSGLQYIGSQGNPDNTNKSISRIRNSIIALILYIFAFAILNYVVPGQVLNK